jgi:molecular chaperone DnaJ
VPVTVSEAILGARITVLGLEGKPLSVRIPPGSHGGRQIRLRGQGLEMPDGRRGDLIASLELWLPEVVDEDAKQAIRDFGERTPKPHRSSVQHATVRQ